MRLASRNSPQDRHSLFTLIPHAATSNRAVTRCPASGPGEADIPVRLRGADRNVQAWTMPLNASGASTHTLLYRNKMRP
jgi:hypothetical protein